MRSDDALQVVLFAEAWKSHRDLISDAGDDSVNDGAVRVTKSVDDRSGRMIGRFSVGDVVKLRVVSTITTNTTTSKPSESSSPSLVDKPDRRRHHRFRLAEHINFAYKHKSTHARMDTHIRSYINTYIHTFCALTLSVSFGLATHQSLVP